MTDHNDHIADTGLRDTLERMARRSGVDLDRVRRGRAERGECQLEGRTPELISHASGTAAVANASARGCNRCGGLCYDPPRDARQGCVPCPGWALHEAARLVARAHIPGRYAVAVKALAAPVGRFFAPSWQPGGRGVWLYGDVGRGKSHTCALVALHLASARRIGVRWLSVPALLREARQSDRFSCQHTRDDVLLRYALEPVLVLDELGCRSGDERQRNYEAEVVSDLVEMRTTMGGRRTTLVTSNLSPGDLAALPDSHHGWSWRRIADRLVELAEPIEVTGPDHRLANASQGGRAR